MKYNVRLDAFEGPLDLLLHLINEAEVDIYDIPMIEITEQYLEYIHAMQELHLDVASEYLVMAATLIAIKSKMLLPKKEELYDDEMLYEEEEDPREELMNRLIQYRKYKEVAKELQEKEVERAFVHSKPPIPLQTLLPDVTRKEAMIEGVTINDMILAYKKMLVRLKYREPLEKTVKTQEYSIEERMSELLVQLQNTKEKRTFSSLFVKRERSYIVITFLAILELMKKGKIVCTQQKNFSDIYISLKEEEELFC